MDLTTGVDVSRFQHPKDAAGNLKPIDWSAVAATGRQFAVVKASDGRGTIGGELFKADYQAIKDAGMLRGGYHFYEASSPGKAQADVFLSQLSGFEKGDMRPTLDVESGGWGKFAGGGFERSAGVTNEQIVAEVRVWLTTVEAALGIRPLIYSDPFSWSNIGSPDFTDYPLWMARVGLGGAPISALNKPAAIKPWTSFTLWQFSWTGRIAGIPKDPPLADVDEDRFYGDLDAFKAAVT